MRIDAVLFDKDGTLLDYARSWRAINHNAATLAAAGDQTLYRHLLAVGGMDPETGHVAPDSPLAAGTAAEIAAAWIAGGSPVPLPDLTRGLDAIFRDGVAHVVPTVDLAELFARLRGRGLRLGIASSDGETAIAATAERFGILTSLDFIAGYDSGHGGKPGPGMLLAFCDAVGIEPRRTAVVGDNAHDMAMARSGGAGLRVGVLTGTGTRATLSEAHACLDSIADLEALLDTVAATGTMPAAEA
jgi:phosphoglycolate phosphatase